MAKKETGLEYFAQTQAKKAIIMSRAVSHLKDKIKHETKVYEANMNNPKLSYNDYEKGLYVGLIRGLTHAIHSLTEES